MVFYSKIVFDNLVISKSDTDAGYLFINYIYLTIRIFILTEGKLNQTVTIRLQSFSEVYQILSSSGIKFITNLSELWKLPQLL
jgi:hypothetical protein